MAITQLLNQAATIENSTGNTDRGGRAIYGGPVQIQVRFEQNTRTIVSKDREREPIDGTVFVAPGVTVANGDRITYQGQKYRVMKISSAVLGNGKVHHKELLVQSWSYAA